MHVFRELASVLGNKRVRCLYSALLGAMVVSVPTTLRAGPPLIADDPNTVGPRVVQPILAITAFKQGDETLLGAPILDLTVGMVDSLDATLILSLESLHDASMRPRWTRSGLFAPGLKWQFLSTDRGSLAFSPALFISTEKPEQVAGLLPIQGELTLRDGSSVVGFDAGYVPVRRAADEGFVAVYGSWAATPRVNVLAEVWFVWFGPFNAADLGASIGLDAGVLRNDLRIITAIRTGIASLNLPRVDVAGYLGLQHTFGTP